MTELLAKFRSLVVGSRSVRTSLQIIGIAASFGVALFLSSCGKSNDALSPMASDSSTNLRTGATSTAGLPSSKFAFSTSELALIEETTGTSDWVTVLSGQMKTPAAKEVYVNTSLECGLFTQTLVRSKNMKKDTSVASVSIQVRALIDGNQMPPGTVTYAARTQTLSATLEGAIAGCLSIVTNPDGTQTIVLDQNCVTPEEIELILNTLNAASFNWVASNVPVGAHTISIQARITSSTSVQEGTASAKALVGKGTMIAEVVRAVK